LKHGLDLARATDLFDGRPAYTYPSARPGEQRLVTVAVLDDVMVAAVRTNRRGAIRLISLRRARSAEQKIHRARHS
jgi:uncharacterized DUF497 family protein